MMGTPKSYLSARESPRREGGLEFDLGFQNAFN
jgi:hypothetical protein